jgi:hypothetical protein
MYIAHALAHDHIYMVGINKPGGIAWVTAVNNEEEGSEGETTYDVKYVLGQRRDLAVPCMFVVSNEEEANDSGATSRGAGHRTPRKSRHSISAETPPSGEAGKGGTTAVPAPAPAPAPASSTSSGSGSKAPRRLSLLSSQLDDASQSRLAAFAASFDADIAHNYSPSVTHLVVAACSKPRGQVLEQRTMKYLKAMSAGKWVVSLQWVQDSMHAHRLLSEEPYEVLLLLRLLLLKVLRLLLLISLLLPLQLLQLPQLPPPLPPPDPAGLQD